jgi:hypothetical protein
LNHRGYYREFPHQSNGAARCRCHRRHRHRQRERRDGRERLRRRSPLRNDGADPGRRAAREAQYSPSGARIPRRRSDERAQLGGRQAEFQAAAGALDANSVDLSKAIGMAYGPGAETAFLALWRKHIGFFVDYATGVATKDKAKQEKAVNDLVGYTGDFGAFLASANPNLPKVVVADLVKTHVLTLKDVVDAQAAGDQKKAYTALRSAASHMMMIADPLAMAIAKQFPDKFAK